MATTQPMDGPKVFRSSVGDVTVTGRAHSLSAWFVLSFRLIMGTAFTYAGLEKVTAANGSAEGYLANVAATNGTPLEAVFWWMVATPWFLEFVNVAVSRGERLIGLGLLAGALTRVAAFFGVFMMLLFYFGNWSVEHGPINGDFVYTFAFLAVAAFGAGRILGLDALIERIRADGRPHLERYPKLEYVLGEPRTTCFSDRCPAPLSPTLAHDRSCSASAGKSLPTVSPVGR